MGVFIMVSKVMGIMVIVHIVDQIVVWCIVVVVNIIDPVVF